MLDLDVGIDVSPTAFADWFGRAANNPQSIFASMKWGVGTRQDAIVAALVLLSGSVAAQNQKKEATLQGGRPIANIKESIICCPHERVLLDGWASIDVGGEVVEWLWDLNCDGTFDTMSGSGELWIAAPSRSRSYSVVLVVEDDEGNHSAPDTATVHVMETPPIVTVPADTTVKLGTRLHFRPNVVEVCGRPIRYEWDFDDDGEPEYRSGTNGNTSRVYRKQGKHFARFSVIDEYGRESGGLVVVTVVGRLTSAADRGPGKHGTDQRVE